MKDTEQTNPPDRDYSTISPSAAPLLLLKGLTNIPFARQAAELMVFPEKYEPDFTLKDIDLWARVTHFERRYWSIDQLLADIPAKNILELSSGFSFRGLAAVQQNNIHFIDTDLENVVTDKNKFIDGLTVNKPGIHSKLEVLPLNALDENQFKAVVSRFDDGAVVIINEGLLVYLNTGEKEKLCKIIHDILKQRGGYWITGDIYIKKEINTGFKNNDELTQFFELHKIEENKFDSFEAAEAFFKSAGFVIDKEAVTDYSKITSINYLLQSASPEQLNSLRKAGKIHATWRLRLADG